MKDKIIHTLCRFKEMNRKKYHIIRIGLFGSAAKGCMNEHSDIDVVVELEEQFDKPVDVVSYRQKMNQFLKSRIDREAIYV